MAKITIGQLQEINFFNSDDVVPVYSSTDGTKKISIGDLKDNIFNSLANSQETDDVTNSKFIITTNAEDSIEQKIISFNNLKNNIILSTLTKEDFFGAGEEITSTDLNDITSIGRHYNSSTTTLFSNTPYSSSATTTPIFNLVVENFGENSYRQSFYPIDTYAYSTRDFSINESYQQTSDIEVDINKTYYQFDKHNCIEDEYGENKKYYTPSARVYFTVSTSSSTPGSFYPSSSSLSFSNNAIVNATMRLTINQNEITGVIKQTLLELTSPSYTANIYFNIDEENNEITFSTTEQSDTYLEFDFSNFIGDPSEYIYIQIYGLSDEITRFVTGTIVPDGLVETDFSSVSFSSVTDFNNENQFGRIYNLSYNSVDIDPEDDTINPSQQGWYEHIVTSTFSDWQSLPIITNT